MSTKQSSLKELMAKIHKGFFVNDPYACERAAADLAKSLPVNELGQVASLAAALGQIDLAQHIQGLGATPSLITQFNDSPLPTPMSISEFAHWFFTNHHNHDLVNNCAQGFNQSDCFESFSHLDPALWPLLPSNQKSIERLCHNVVHSQWEFGKSTAKDPARLKVLSALVHMKIDLTQVPCLIELALGKEFAPSYYAQEKNTALCTAPEFKSAHPDNQKSLFAPNLATLDFLLAQGCKPVDRNGLWCVALEKSIRPKLGLNHKSQSIWLWDELEKRNITPDPTSTKFDPLVETIKFGLPGLVPRLTKYGFQGQNIDPKTKQTVWSALALSKKPAKAIECLAHLDLAKINALASQPDHKGRSPLFHAVASLNAPAVARILEAPGTHTLSSPKEHAFGRIKKISIEHAPSLQKILDALTKANVSIDSAAATKLLHAAIQIGVPGIVDWALQNGADINEKSPKGLPVLHHAVEHFAHLFNDGATATIKRQEIYRILKKLIDAGADVNALDREANTPLHKAADRIADGVVELLLRCGATPDAQNCVGARACDSFYMQYYITRGQIQPGVNPLVPVENIIKSFFYHGLDFEQKTPIGTPFEKLSADTPALQAVIHHLVQSQKDQRAISAVLEDELGVIAPLNPAPKRKM